MVDKQQVKDIKEHIKQYNLNNPEKPSEKVVEEIPQLKNAFPKLNDSFETAKTNYPTQPHPFDQDAEPIKIDENAYIWEPDDYFDSAANAVPQTPIATQPVVNPQTNYQAPPHPFEEPLTVNYIDDNHFETADKAVPQKHITTKPVYQPTKQVVKQPDKNNNTINGLKSMHGNIRNPKKLEEEEFDVEWEKDYNTQPVEEIAPKPVQVTETLEQKTEQVATNQNIPIQTEPIMLIVNAELDDLIMAIGKNN